MWRMLLLLLTKHIATAVTEWTDSVAFLFSFSPLWLTHNLYDATFFRVLVSLSQLGQRQS